MAVALYMDVHVPRPITYGLRLRGVDVLTAQEDGTAQLSDAQLLDRAKELRRIMVTSDKDFLIEASQRQAEGLPFTGVVFIHFSDISIGRCINSLSVYALAGDQEDFMNRVEYLA
jgi:predicted nuclease of predicted toxin-antitoxin system